MDATLSISASYKNGAIDYYIKALNKVRILLFIKYLERIS